jgi:predicted Zn-dependent peptidase
MRSVALGYWIRSGVASEPARLQGVSHFLEHLIFKGTGTRSARDISEGFDRIGGEVNAYTAKEYTCFYFRVVDEHLPQAVEIMTDMICHSRLEPDDVAKERNVILEEVGMYEDSPDEYVHDLLAQAIWPEHPLGRSILGTRETLRELAADDLRQFYGQHYHAGNMVISAAGNVDHERLATELSKHLSLKEQAEGLLTVQPPTISPRNLWVEKPTEQLHLALGLPGLPLGHPRLYAWNLLNNILGSGMSSRLFRQLREEHALVYNAYSYTASFTQSGYSAIYLGLAPHNLGKALELIATELSSLSSQTVSSEELGRAKAQVKGSLVMGLESTANHMSRLGRGLLLLKRVQPIEQIMAAIEAVTAEDLRQLARELFERRMLAAAAVGRVEQVQELLDGFNW